MKYEEETGRTRQAKQALDMLRDTLRSEMEFHTRAKTELESAKLKLDEEKSKRERTPLSGDVSPEPAAARRPQPSASEREIEFEVFKMTRMTVLMTC